MRKGFLAGTCALGTSAAIGFVLWVGASGAAFGQEGTTPGPGNPKAGEPARADTTRPGFFQRLFRRPQTQVQNSVAPAQKPATAVAATCQLAAAGEEASSRTSAT